MNFQSVAQTTSLTLLATASASAVAHEGHGLLGGHWHATDALGFVAVALLAAVAVWLSGK